MILFAKYLKTIPTVLVYEFIALSSLQAQSILYWGGGTASPSVSVDSLASASDTESLKANLSGVWGPDIANFNPDPTATSGWIPWNGDKIFGFKSNYVGNNGNPVIQLASDMSVAGVSVNFVAGATNQSVTFVGGAGGENRKLLLKSGSEISISSNTQSNTLNIMHSKDGHGGVTLEGSHGFSMLGKNEYGIPSSQPTLNINSLSTLSGDVVIHHGKLLFGNWFSEKSGLPNVLEFTMGSNESSLWIFGNDKTDIVNDLALLRLHSGELLLQTRNSDVPIVETLGSIVLEGSGTILTDPRPNQQATVQSTLHLANGFTRGDNGMGVLVASNSKNTDGGLGTANGLKISGHGFPSGQAVIPIGVVQGRYKNIATGVDEGGESSARFMATDPSGNLGGANSLSAINDLSEWDTTYTINSNIHYESQGEGAFMNALDADTSIGTLAVGGSLSNEKVVMDFGGFAMKANAIAFCSNGVADFEIGTKDSAGTLTANDGKKDLILIHKKSNSSGKSDVHLRTVVTDNSAPVNLILAGPDGTFQIHKENTHTGKTFIQCGGSYGSNRKLYEKFSSGVIIENQNAFASSSEINISSGSLLRFQGGRNSSAFILGGGNRSQVLSGGGSPRFLPNLALANDRSMDVGANGIIAPGDAGTNEKLVFLFGGAGKLNFLPASTLNLDLGPANNSDAIEFLGESSGDWLSGSGNATLQLTLGPGFFYGGKYVVFDNVSTPGFNFASIKGFDSLNYRADFRQEGNAYVLSFTQIGKGAKKGTYISWASANGIPNEPADGDFDKDGFPNLLEYAVDGMDPARVDKAIGIRRGNTVTFDKRPEAVFNGDVDYAIEITKQPDGKGGWTMGVAQETKESISFLFADDRQQEHIRLIVGKSP